MQDIIMGIISKNKVISIQEIQRITGFEEAEIRNIIVQLNAEKKISYNAKSGVRTSCGSCPLRNICKAGRYKYEWRAN